MNQFISFSKMKLIRLSKYYRQIKKDKLLSMSMLSQIINSNLWYLPISIISVTGLGLIKILLEYLMLIARIKHKLVIVSNVSIWLKLQPLYLLKHLLSYLLLMLSCLLLLIPYSKIYFLKINQPHLEYSHNQHHNSKRMYNTEQYE
jgi:hypothetical protein